MPKGPPPGEDQGREAAWAALNESIAVVASLPRGYVTDSGRASALAAQANLSAGWDALNATDYPGGPERLRPG